MESARGVTERLGEHQRKVKTVGILIGAALVFLLIVYLFFVGNLPPIKNVTDYRPATTTQIFSADLALIGEFAKEYRHLTPLENIPLKVRQAFMASEDEHFFEHRGVDFFGIARAMLKNLQSGSVRQGGSTITQQVAKSLLLTPERTFSRKIKEALLAFKIENTLSKEEILYLYLNQVYLGHGAYGVSSGARVYFNKELNQLDLSEMALMAGVLTAPSRYNPFKNPQRALERRSYVLRKMNELNFIDDKERQAADQQALKLDDGNRELNRQASPYFTEHIRRYLADKYGDDAVYQGGLKVYTTLSQPMQRAAEEAVKWNLQELDKRQGYRGPLKRLNEAEIKTYLADWEKRRTEALATEPATKSKPHRPAFSGEELFREPLQEALVAEVENAKKRVKVYTQTDQGYLPLALMDWARKPNEQLTMEEARLTQPSQALKRGDMILVRYADPSELKAELKTAKGEKSDYAETTLFALGQEPEVQGAMVAMNPENGFVLAMVGGYDFAKSEFNRAFQARRQPGSAFKPILYSAALDKGYTPVTMILDAPVVFDDPSNDSIWRPKNYSGNFQGDIPFRTALIESRNVVTVKILQDIGIDYAMEYARKLGIESPMARDNTIALGSSVVTPLELTVAYTPFASGGVKRTPIFIKKIIDRDGVVLERHTQDEPAVPLRLQVAEMERDLLGATITPIVAPTPATENAEGESSGPDSGPNGVDKAEVRLKEDSPSATGNAPLKLRVTRLNQVISEETAFITTHLLNEVVTYGTGYRARALNRPAAGKTGTTNEQVDAWFVGYTPDLIATAWVGFDDPKRTLGKLETGAKAASPMWLKFMVPSMEGRPQKAFRVPAGITFVKIDSETGKLATDKTAKPVLEAFRDGTQPTEEGATKSSTQDFFIGE